MSLINNANSEMQCLSLENEAMNNGDVPGSAAINASTVMNQTKGKWVDSEQVHQSSIDCEKMAYVLMNNGIDIETNVLQITFDATQYTMKQLLSDLCDIFTCTDNNTLLPSIIKQMLDLDNDIQTQQNIYNAILRSGFITKNDLNPHNFIPILKIAAYEVNTKLNLQEIEQVAIKTHLSGQIYTHDAPEYMNSLQFGALFKSIHSIVPWNQIQWAIIYKKIDNWTSDNADSADPSQVLMDNMVRVLCAKFCTATNADRDIALIYLQQSAWNVDAAVATYFRELNVVVDASNVKPDIKTRREFIDDELSKNGAERVWTIFLRSCGIIIVLCIALVIWAVVGLFSGSDFPIYVVIAPIAVVECIVIAAIYDGMKGHNYYFHIAGCGWIVIHIIALAIAIPSLIDTIPAAFIVILIFALGLQVGIAVKLTFQIKKARQAWTTWTTLHSKERKPTQSQMDIGDDTVLIVKDVLRNVFIDGSESHLFLDELQDMLPQYGVDIDKETLEYVVQTLEEYNQIWYIKSEQKIEPTNIIDGDQIVHKVPVVLAGSETDEKEKIINNDEDHEVLIKNDVGPALPSVEIVNDSDSEEMYGFKSTFNEAPPIGSASPGDICVGSPGSPGYTKQ
eukprot:160281_1